MGMSFRRIRPSRWATVALPIWIWARAMATRSFGHSAHLRAGQHPSRSPRGITRSISIILRSRRPAPELPGSKIEPENQDRYSRIFVRVYAIRKSSAFGIALATGYPLPSPSWLVDIPFEGIAYPAGGELPAVHAGASPDGRRPAEKPQPRSGDIGTRRSSLAIQLGDEITTCSRANAILRQIVAEISHLRMFVRHPAVTSDIARSSFSSYPHVTCRGLSWQLAPRADAARYLSSIGRTAGHSKSMVAMPAKGLTSCTTTAPRSIKEALNPGPTKFRAQGLIESQPKLCVTGESTPSKTAYAPAHSIQVARYRDKMERASRNSSKPVLRRVRVVVKDQIRKYHRIVTVHTRPLPTSM